VSATPTRTAPAVQPTRAPTPGATMVPTRAESAAPAPVHPTPTPRLLRGIRNALVAVLLLFSGLTVVATVAPEMALGTSVADITLGQQLRGARATLAEADRKASVAFLAPATAASNGEWTDYQSTIDQVSAMLLRAAADHPDDADELATVQTQISDYRRSVDAAWTLAGTGSAAGPASSSRRVRSSMPRCRRSRPWLGRATPAWVRVPAGSSDRGRWRQGGSP